MWGGRWPRPGPSGGTPSLGTPARRVRGFPALGWRGGGRGPPEDVPAAGGARVPAACPARALPAGAAGRRPRRLHQQPVKIKAEPRAFLSPHRARGAILSAGAAAGTRRPAAAPGGGPVGRWWVLMPAHAQPPGAHRRPRGGYVHGRRAPADAPRHHCGPGCRGHGPGRAAHGHAGSARAWPGPGSARIAAGSEAAAHEAPPRGWRGGSESVRVARPPESPRGLPSCRGHPAARGHWQPVPSPRHAADPLRLTADSGPVAAALPSESLIWSESESDVATLGLCPRPGT